MDLYLADLYLGAFGSVHVLQQVHQAVFRIPVEQLIHMHFAVLAGGHFQLAHQLGCGFAYRVGDPHRGFRPFGHRHGAVHIAALQGPFQGFFAGPLEIAQIGQGIAIILFDFRLSFLANDQFDRFQFSDRFLVQFQMVHFHPAEGGTRQFVKLFFAHVLRLPLTWNLSVPD